MVKASGLPSHTRMTALAVSGESGLDMVRVGGCVEVLLVARHTIGRGITVALFVTCLTIVDGVCAGKWELGLIVIEGGGLPCYAGVAGFAVGGEPGLYVVGVGGGVEVLLVARHAIG